MYGSSKSRGGPSPKNAGVLLIIMLAGLVVGGFIGQLMRLLADAAPWASFLKVMDYREPIGFEPVSVELGVITLTLGVMFNFSIWSIIGLTAAILIYRRI